MLNSFGWLPLHMKTLYPKALCLIVLLTVIISLMPIGRTQGQAQDTLVSFLVRNHPDGDKTYELNITIPHSLYEYYKQQVHFLFSPRDFQMFITPYTMKPVADRLWQIYNNTEGFTNGVLEIVHQIPYEEIIESKYPIETLVDGKGDCDLFVYIAASILEAGGIPTVLLFYEEEKHMQLAVRIESKPEDARGSIYSVTHQNNSYYIAEATGSKWRQGWRIGENPENYQNASYQIIGPTLRLLPIGQVSATLRELDPSILTLHLSTPLLLENGNIQITGQILPCTPNENVSLYGRSNGGNWFTIDSVQTGEDGKFSYDWVIATVGTMEVQASWVGNHQLNGAISAVGNVFVLPLYLLLLIVTLTVMCMLVIAIFMVNKHNRKNSAEIALAHS